MTRANLCVDTKIRGGGGGDFNPPLRVLPVPSTGALSVWLRQMLALFPSLLHWAPPPDLPGSSGPLTFFPSLPVQGHTTQLLSRPPSTPSLDCWSNLCWRICHNLLWRGWPMCVHMHVGRVTQMVWLWGVGRLKNSRCTLVSMCMHVLVPGARKEAAKPRLIHMSQQQFMCGETANSLHSPALQQHAGQTQWSALCTCSLPKFLRTLKTPPNLFKLWKWEIKKVHVCTHTYKTNAIPLKCDKYCMA